MPDRNFRICLPIEQQPQGGMYTFLGYFRAYMTNIGISITNDIQDRYDVLFVNSWKVDAKSVYKAKIRDRECRIVQRVDGSAWDYGRRDDADKRQARVNILADLTIFQSQYCKYSTMSKFHVISQDGPVIYNPVDVSVFCPEGEKAELPGEIKVAHVTYSTNPRKGAKSLLEIARHNPDLAFFFIGPYESLPHLSNVHRLGYVDRQTLPQVLRSCSVFVHTAENDPCPNVVLEALASGLPVLYKDSGGTPELVGNAGVPVEVENFRQQLEQVLSKRTEFSQAARYRAVMHFAPGVIFPQYLQAIATASRRPLPNWKDKVDLYRRILPLMLRRQRVTLTDRSSQLRSRLVAKINRTMATLLMRVK